MEDASSSFSNEFERVQKKERKKRYLSFISIHYNFFLYLEYTEEMVDISYLSIKFMGNFWGWVVTR